MESNAHLISLPKCIIAKILSVNLEIEDYQSLRLTCKFFQRQIDSLDFWKNFYSLSFGKSLEKVFKDEKVALWNELSKEKVFWNRLIYVHKLTCKHEKWNYYFDPQSYITRVNTHLLEIYVKLRGIDIIPGLNHRNSLNYGKWYGFAYTDTSMYLNTHLRLFKYERKDYNWNKWLQFPHDCIKNIAKTLIRKPSKNFFKRIQNILKVFSKKAQNAGENKSPNIHEIFATFIIMYMNELLWDEQSIPNLVDKIKDLKRIVYDLEMGDYIAKYNYWREIPILEIPIEYEIRRDIIENFISNLLEK